MFETPPILTQSGVLPETDLEVLKNERRQEHSQKDDDTFLECFSHGGKGGWGLHSFFFNIRIA